MKHPKRRPASKSTARSDERLTALVANTRGEIFELDGYAALGMAGATFTPLTRGMTRTLSHGGELMYLPDRSPVLYNCRRGAIECLDENPYAPGEPLFPVAAFNSPGNLITYHCAFRERPGASSLPLFAYGAVGWLGGAFRSAFIRVDREPRQDLRLMPRAQVVAGIHRMQKRLPGNRLRAHLETCALAYGCPAGKNFFLARCEAPLPTSRVCNARCLGCLSLQSDPEIPSTQCRIAFTPSPEEIADVAVAHLRRVPDGVVSFGQGCEGEPLLAAEVIEPALRIIRRTTGAGTINMNTNASRPAILERLFAAGLDSLRVSLNSLRPACYAAYYRPQDYGLAEVVQSVDLGLRLGKWVSLNYLNLPGFTDLPAEVRALEAFLADHAVHMIQWRNLNYDPLRYHQRMQQASAGGAPLGMEALLRRIRQAFPALRHGYFNPALKKGTPQPVTPLA